jgi:hypothetical protein
VTANVNTISSNRKHRRLPTQWQRGSGDVIKINSQRICLLEAWLQLLTF